MQTASTARSACWGCPPGWVSGGRLVHWL